MAGDVRRVSASTRARSGAAPSRAKTLARGVELERGRVLVAERGAGPADQHVHPSGLVRRFERAPRLLGPAQRDQRAARRHPRPARRPRAPVRPSRRAARPSSARRSPRAPAAPSPAASTSPVASMISTCAGSSAARSGGSVASASTRRIAAAATLRLPCARRNSARPGCGSSPPRSPCDRPPRPPRARRAGDGPRPPGRRPGGRRLRSTASRQRSPARRASCSASGHAPWSCMISARCTRHVPVKLTMSGCCSHQRVSAAVHSWARRGS